MRNFDTTPSFPKTPTNPMDGLCINKIVNSNKLWDKVSWENKGSQSSSSKLRIVAIRATRDGEMRRIGFNEPGTQGDNSSSALRAPALSAVTFFSFLKWLLEISYFVRILSWYNYKETVLIGTIILWNSILQNFESGVSMLFWSGKI